MYMEKIMNYINARDFGASGSSFETVGHTVAGSDRIVLDDIGDFEVGQQIKMSDVLPRCTCFCYFDPPPSRKITRQAGNEVEFRGWDGSNGDHVVYYLDIDPTNTSVCRWSDDQGRSWHNDLTAPSDHEWHLLSGGLEIRFGDFENKGGVFVIVMQASLTAEILAIDGNTITVDNAPQKTAVGTVVHSDTKALQRAIDTALAENADLIIPEGYYRLADSLVVDNAKSLTIRGASPERTILDIGVGGIGIEMPGGSCIILKGGEEVKLYDLGFRGAVGFDRRDQAGNCFARGAIGVWGFYFMKCNALSCWSTRRVYVENCHAKMMSAECFYSASTSRTSESEPEQYTTSITYMRCSVENCARNAFNNNDKAENTHIIDCRIRDVGGCSWEGASRFVEMRGCYVRNSGSVAMGNIRSRSGEYEILGSGQHVIADNTFEECCPYGGAMISIGAGASQIIIRGNRFVNFNSNAIDVMGYMGVTDLPCRAVIISGNSFDMTAVSSPSKPRRAIFIGASDVTVSDNQIYSTVQDDNLTGIEIRNDAQGLIIHDNLFRGMGCAFKNTDTKGCVTEVIDEYSFICRPNEPPILRRRSHRYRGWLITFSDGSVSTVADFDPETRIFTLSEARQLKNGDTFTMQARYPDGRLMCERLMHDNLIV